MSSVPATSSRFTLGSFSAVLLLAACGGPQHEYDQPQEAFSESKDPGGSTPRPGEVAAPENSGRTMNEVIVDCERHIRSWEFAQGNAKSQTERQQLGVLAEAFALYVQREMKMVREAALSGAERSRGIASVSLGFSGDLSALPILLNNLSDSSTEVVANSLFGLGMLGAIDTPAQMMLDAVDMHRDDASVVRNGAFAAAELARVRHASNRDNIPQEDGLDRLLMLLIDRPEAGVRAQAASGLGYIEHQPALPQLFNLLAGDPEPSVRFAAAFAMGEVGSSEAGIPLVDALDDPNRMVGGAARAALAKLYGQDLGPDPKAWAARVRR